MPKRPTSWDPALYHSVLAAVAEGNATRGGIASYIGRKTADISHPLTVLEDCGLVVREPDAIRTGRSRYRIAEPLVRFYQAIMRPAWRRLELDEAAVVWRDARQRFASQVVGPHFEALCREHARGAGVLFGAQPGEVLAGTVADPVHRTQIEVDVVALAPTTPGQPRRILALGEAKWGSVMDERHLERLRRARDLLAAKGHDARDAVLVCYGALGFTPDLTQRAPRDHALLVDLNQLYDEL